MNPQGRQEGSTQHIQEDVCCHPATATWACFQGWLYPWRPGECRASPGTRSCQLTLAGHGRDQSAMLGRMGTAPWHSGHKWAGSCIPPCIPARGIVGKQDPRGELCRAAQGSASPAGDGS